jgi:hypothetical protein
LDQIRKNLILWAVLAIIVCIDTISYPLGRLFTTLDLAFLAAVILMLRGRIVTAYITAGASAAIQDMLFSPFFGPHLCSAILGTAAAQAMCALLFRDNYATKVLIVAASVAAMYAARAALVFVFYWDMKSFYFPAEALLKIIMTTLLGAAVLKIAEAGTKGFSKWLKTILQRT